MHHSTYINVYSHIYNHIIYRCFTVDRRLLGQTPLCYRSAFPLVDRSLGPHYTVRTIDYMWSFLVLCAFVPGTLYSCRSLTCAVLSVTTEIILELDRYDHEVYHITIPHHLLYTLATITVVLFYSALVKHCLAAVSSCIHSMYVSKVMFCRVCGFRVRVWESYRTSRSFGNGYGSVTELTEVPGIVARAYRTHRSSGRVQKMLYPYPGYCGMGHTERTDVPGTGMNVLQNSQKFWVRV